MYWNNFHRILSELRKHKSMKDMKGLPWSYDFIVDVTLCDNNINRFIARQLDQNLVFVITSPIEILLLQTYLSYPFCFKLLLV